MSPARKRAGAKGRKALSAVELDCHIKRVLTRPLRATVWTLRFALHGRHYLFTGTLDIPTCVGTARGLTNNQDQDKRTPENPRARNLAM